MTTEIKKLSALYQPINGVLPMSQAQHDACADIERDIYSFGDVSPDFAYANYSGDESYTPLMICIGDQSGMCLANFIALLKTGKSCPNYESENGTSALSLLTERYADVLAKRMLYIKSGAKYANYPDPEIYKMAIDALNKNR